jgi:hypothetical protein
MAPKEGEKSHAGVSEALGRSALIWNLDILQSTWRVCIITNSRTSHGSVNLMASAIRLNHDHRLIDIGIL